MKKSWKAGTMVYPLPAVMVSCGTDESNYNIMTAAWTGTICSEPAMCYVSIRPERHSYQIIKQSGEFVINLTTEALAKVTDWCGVRSGRDFNKFEHCNLTLEKCAVVSAPAILESPISIECRVKNIVPLGSHDMFIAEVVNVLVDEQYCDPTTGKLDLQKAKLLCYSHGEYFGIGKYIGYYGYTVKGSTIAKEKRATKK